MGAKSWAGRPLDVFCRAESVLAVVLATEGVAVLLALAPGVEGERWLRLGLVSLFAQWVALVWVAGLCVARLSLARYAPLRVAWIAVLWLVVVSVAVARGAFWVLTEAGVRLGRAADFVGHVAVMAVVLGLLGVLGFYAFWQAQGWALRAREAELEALHARIRPHFLFNTLNAIASLIPSRPEDAERMVEALARMLRSSLEGPQKVPLAEELRLTRDYLAIEQMRLEQRLRVHWHLPEPLPAVLIPSLILQPLVENAVRYGVEPAREGGEVEIVVQSVGEDVHILVRNSVPIGDASLTRQRGHGLALENIRARIEAWYGARGRLEVACGEKTYAVKLHLPGERGGQ